MSAEESPSDALKRFVGENESDLRNLLELYGDPNELMSDIIHQLHVTEEHVCRDQLDKLHQSEKFIATVSDALPPIVKVRLTVTTGDGYLSTKCFALGTRVGACGRPSDQGYFIQYNSLTGVYNVVTGPFSASVGRCTSQIDELIASRGLWRHLSGETCDPDDIPKE